MSKKDSPHLTTAHISGSADSIARVIQKLLYRGRSVAWVTADGSVVITPENAAGMVPDDQVLGVFHDNIPLYEIRLDVVEMQKHRARNAPSA